MSPRQIRERAGLTMIQAAVRAAKAEGTIRLYEASPEAVSRRSREALDRFYGDLVASIKPGPRAAGSTT